MNDRALDAGSRQTVDHQALVPIKHGEDLPQRGRPQQRSEQKNIDLLTGGFPCQPFSRKGLGAGVDDERGGIFYQILHYVAESRPRAVVLENVKGLVTGHWQAFEENVHRCRSVCNVL